MAVSDLQRAAIIGVVVLGALAVAGVVGLSAMAGFEARERETTHYVPGRDNSIPDRRDCLNQYLRERPKFDRQAIYNRTVDCEQIIQSLEGHAQMERNGQQRPE